MVCPICDGTGKISVSTYMRGDGEVIHPLIAPCPMCKCKNEKDNCPT